MNTKERHFFQVNTPWARQDQPFVSFATGVASCVVPSGACKRKEEDEDAAGEDQDDSPDSDEDDEASNDRSRDSAYVVPAEQSDESHFEEPTLVHWRSIQVQLRGTCTTVARALLNGLQWLWTCFPYV